MKKDNKDAAKEAKKEAKKEDAPAKQESATNDPAANQAAPGAPAPDAGSQPMPAAGPVIGISADDLGSGKDMPSFDMTRGPASDSGGTAGDIYIPPVIPNVGPVLPTIIDPGMFNRDKSNLHINIRQ
jgi:hypothetical protein